MGDRWLMQSVGVAIRRPGRNCGTRVDIFLNETSFQSSLMRRRQRFQIAGDSIEIVTAEDLILLKLLANRPRDLGDVADVLFVQGQLDNTYMQQWAETLGIADQLRAVLTEPQ